MTRFGKMLLLWQNFDGIFNIWQNFESTLHYWVNFHCCKWPNIKKLSGHLVTMMPKLPTRHVPMDEGQTAHVKLHLSKLTY